MFKKIQKIFICVIVLCSMTFVTGCKSKKKQVAYSVYPVGYLLDRIAGDTVNKVCLQNNTIVQKATIVENYEEILKDSAAFFHIGGLEPYLSAYAADIKATEVQSVDLSVMNSIYDFARYTKKGNEFIESPYYDGDSFDSVDVNDQDLNLWLDPIAMLSMAKDITKWLISYYPENEDLYTSNLDSLETDLINLDAQYQNLSSKLAKSNSTIRFATMSASFGNWQKTYGFEVYPVVMSKFGALPNETQLQAIKDRLTADNVQYLLYEPNMTEDMITLYDSILEELGMTRIQLSNLSSETDQEEADGKDYLSIMYENLSVLSTLSSVSISPEIQ